MEPPGLLLPPPLIPIGRIGAVQRTPQAFINERGLSSADACARGNAIDSDANTRCIDRVAHCVPI
jgi:hypothetical protein